LERNPHIQEPDDIFPGVTLRLRPHWWLRSRK
jgi:hypothetical protein